MAEGSSRKRARWGEGRVAYAALAPEIAKALEEGLPMTKVYALFEAAFPCLIRATLISG